MSDERKAGEEQPRTVLVFKHEDEVDGEPIGPATVFTDTRADRTQAKVETVPFVPPCVCEPREGSPGERPALGAGADRRGGLTVAAKRPTPALFARPVAGRAVTLTIYTRPPAGQPVSSLPLASQARQCEEAAAEIGAQVSRSGAPSSSPTRTVKKS